MLFCLKVLTKQVKVIAFPVAVSCSQKSANQISPNKVVRKVRQWQTWHLIKSHSSLLNDCTVFRPPLTKAMFSTSINSGESLLSILNSLGECALFVQALVWLGPHGLISVFWRLAKGKMDCFVYFSVPQWYRPHLTG